MQDTDPRPRLYSGPLSMFGAKAQIAALEKGIEVELVMVPFDFDKLYAPDCNDWRYDPMLLPLTGLPPTLVVTASLDPLRDQGRAFAAGLAQAGVDALYLECRGTIHGFMNMRKALPSAQADLERCTARLRHLLA